MKRKIKATRIAAFLLAIVLFFNNEQMIYALASSTDNQIIDTNTYTTPDDNIANEDDNDSISSGNETAEADSEHCEHEWIADPETSLTICSKCGTEKQEEDVNADEGATDDLFLEDDVECEHEWIRDPETLLIICSKCGEYNYDYEEDECPDGGFHIYVLKEDGTGYVCVNCGTEKEILDALDVTLEMYINATSEQISMLAVTDADDPASSTLPKTLDELEAYGSEELIVASLGDLLVVQDLSKQTDFEGYTIKMAQRSIGDLSLNQSTYTWDLQNISSFTGLGDADHPFSGTFVSGYTSGLNYKLDKPLFSYLSTDAVISNLNIVGAITGTDTAPKGIIAGVLVRKDDEDSAESLTMNNIILDGSVSNSNGAAGMAFGRIEAANDSPVNLNFNSSAVKLCQTNAGTVSGLHAGGIAGETVGNVTVNITDPAVTGKVMIRSVSTWDNSNNESGQLDLDATSAAGMYVGAMDGGTLIIEGSSTPYTVDVQRASGHGGANGGLVGMAVGTKVYSNATADNPITISGTGVVGRISGGVLGYYDHRDEDASLQLDYITVSAPVNAAGDDNYFAGGVLGRYYHNEDGGADKNYDIINHITVSSTVSAAYFAGGVVGFAHGANLRIGGSDPESIVVTGSVTNTSTWSSDAARIEADPWGAGGVVGLISGQYVEIQNAVVNTTFDYRTAAMGGIAGAVGKIKSGFDDNGRRSIIKIDNATVTATFGSDVNKWRGGLLGMVFSGSMVALDGTINVDGMSSSQRFGRMGHIAGYQKESLIYWEESASYSRPANKNWVDDIGNYGGVYRNGSWGEAGAKLISYEEGKVAGEVGKSGDTWVIDSEADFIRLAIMLNTQGNYAANCFENADKITLLAADYSVTNSLDLTNSGIYSLNRNDSIGMNESELFSGTFRGTGSGDIRIQLGDLKTRQSYLALFPGVGGGNDEAKTSEISGFELKRTIDGASLYAAGIACQALGNFTAKDIYVNLTSDDPAVLVGIHSFYGGNNLAGTDLYYVSHYYGGLVAKVDSKGATDFTVDSVKIGGTLKANSNTTNLIMGGMVAVYTQSGTAPSTVSVKDFELMGDFKLTSSGRTCSGMITQLNAGQTVNGSTGMNLDSTRISMQNIMIHNGASIEESYNGIDTNNPGGGWLGLTWKNIFPDENAHYSIDGITIGDGGTAADGPSFTSKGMFGGLIDTVTGRIQLKNINIKNGIFNNSNSKDRVGLLFRVGNDALIEIDGYTIDGREIGDLSGADNTGSVQVTGCNKINFDEIVAYNIGSNTNGNNDYKTGGIVNIIYDDFSDETNANHRTYQNRLLEPKNDRTRYYYNLFGNSFDTEDTYLSDSKQLTKNGTVVTNDRQMMIWHLSQYMNNSIRGYLQSYYSESIDNLLRNQDTTFEGEINLEKVSYYPTPVSGGTYTFTDNARIIFYGEDITNKATDTMTPSSDQKQHYMMHSGLFISQTGDVTVEGADHDNFLTLSGSVTNLGANSGALFSRDIQGTKKIYRVCLKDIYLADYDAEDPAGLMIGIVKDDSNLDLSWVETAGYSNFKGKAASALIGTVGTPEASKISIEFKNIKVDSRKDGIFEYASLIDENYYVEDTTNATAAIRRIRYLFTEAAFMGTDGTTSVYPFDGTNAYYGNDQYADVDSYVTIGSELAEGIEYWDVTDGPEENTAYLLPFVGTLTWNEENVKDTYLPYVHITAHEGSKEIEVNPKNVSITEGCGTYEDPYVIDNAKQLLALARYLQNKNDYKYLGGWQINVYQSGRSGGICNGNHTENDLRTYPADGGTLPEGFPTQEELSQAYYLITDDIDLSAMSNATDRQIAEDFVGLGTQAIPFRGVIVGQKFTDDNGEQRYPVITLPRRSNWTKDTADVNHGLIQYAKGTVVRDLMICGAQDSADGTRTGVAKVKNMAGGIIACVLGGDNIIDNVSVELKCALADAGGQAGAYVGNVKQGSVILRNLSEASAKEFYVGSWNAAGANSEFRAFDETDLEKYPYVSGLIGKVEDGCVIYEDEFGNGTAYSAGPVLAHEEKTITGIYKNAMLPICKHYDIIVKSWLDKDTTGGIVITDSTDADGKKNFTASITNAAQLQIVSMAINSDAFSVYYKDGGYNMDAACRKAEYSQVGNVTDSGAGSDFLAATTEDDEVYDYPYLYDYFSFQNAGGRQGTIIEVTDASGIGYISQLNAATADVKAIMNYELQNTTYDMAVYGRGFRGLGATYGMLSSVSLQNGRVSADTLNNSFYSDFRANFLGNGATINVAIDRNYDSSIHTAALFNDLLDRTAAADNLYTIEKITVTGSVVSVEKTTDVNRNDTTDGNADVPDRTAAVAGLMRRPWNLSNITVKDMTIEAKGHAGGIVAWVEPEAGKTLNFTFDRCRVEGGSKGTQIYSYGGSVGGIIGVLTQNGSSTKFDKVSLNLQGCTIAGTGSSNVVIEVKNRTADRNDSDLESSGNNVQMAAGRSGGLIGYIGRRFVKFEVPSVKVTIEDKDNVTTQVAYARITGAYSTGGLIGEYDALQSDSAATPSSVTITNAEVKNCEIEGTRGNTDSRDDYFDYGVGGLIGEMRGYALSIGGTDYNAVVSDTDIVSSAASGYGMYAGGVVGCLKTRTATLTNTKVTGTIDNTTAIERGGQQYTIKSVMSDAGGVIGRAVGENAVVPRLTMSGMQVSGMSITYGDWDAAEAFAVSSSVTTRQAGGLIGTNEMSLTISGTDSSQPDSGALVERCMITASGGNVGGMVGYLYREYGYTTYALRTTDIQNVAVRDSIIGYNDLCIFNSNQLAYGAGGIYGDIPAFSTSGVEHRLENAEVSGCWIYGTSAGGVLGYADKYAKLSSNKTGTGTQNSIEVKNNNIYGMRVGGAIGYCSSAQVNYIGMNIEDNHIQAYKYSSTAAAYAGGFCGYAENGTGQTDTWYLDYISIKNNYILAANENSSNNRLISAGGFFGYSKLKNCYIYRPELTDNLIGYSETDHGKALLNIPSGEQRNIETLQMLFNSADGEIGGAARTVSLITGTSTSNLQTVAMPAADDIRTNKVGYYAGRIGNFVGTYGDNAHTYFLAPLVTYTSAFSGTRPVIDVGMSAGTAKGTADTGDKLLGSPYAYRNSIHIIYHDAENVPDSDAEIWRNATVDSTTGNWEYLFDGISYQKIIEAYRETETTTDISEYLDAYRLGVKADAEGTEYIEDVYEKLYRNSDGTLQTPLQVGSEMLPVIYLDTQYGTADQMVKGVVAALTGVGGVYNCNEDNGNYSSGMGAVTRIETTPMKIENDQIVTDTSGTASLSASKTSAGKWTVEYKDYDSDGYDLEGNFTETPTFTLLTITWSWKYNALGTSNPIERTEVIRIPVFVVERLTIDTHLKIIEDLVYNADKVKEEGLCSNVVVANDSSYTLYTEYIYGDARKKYTNTAIEKHIGTYVDENGMEVDCGFAPGTKLTLIDIDDDNRVYYYTVGEGETGPIPYSSFRDENGNSYVNKIISQDDGFKIYGEDETFISTDMVQLAGGGETLEEFEYSNVAVERFLITVDIQGVEEADRIGEDLRIFDISPELNETLEKKTTLTEHTTLLAAIQPGMTIEFTGQNESDQEEKTWIEGNIKASEEEGFVNIWATIDISANIFYWTAVSQNGANTIDSANNNKYLELQIYMTTPGSDQEIALPSGTNVSIEGERTKPDEIYVDGVENSIDRTSLDPYYDTASIYFYKDGNLKFKLNDLSKLILAEKEKNQITDGVIRWIDKLTLDFRNADMTPYDQDSYTMHINLLRMEDPDYPVGGEILDTYSREIAAARKQDLACAVETKDLMQLGINTYENQTTMPHEIDFDFKLDFTGVLSGIEATDKVMADKHYTVAYRIWEKAYENGTMKYIPYTGDQLELELVNALQAESLNLTTSENASTRGLQYWYTDYQFTWDEISNGTVVRSLKLTVKDAASMDLSNYKVQAIVYVSDDEMITNQLDLDSITPLTDFFVFTVAKLKTDLDY